MSDERNYYDGTNPRFAKTSMVMGIISIAMLWTGFLSVMFGGVGILFAMLSARKGKALPSKAKIGLPISIAGVVIGLIITISSVMTVVQSYKSGEFFNEFEKMYEQMYGDEFNWKDFGMDPDGFETFQDYLDQAGTIEG